MTDREKFLKVMEVAVNSVTPELEVLPKSESKLMLLINWLFNLWSAKDSFLKRFWTTIGYTVYYPIHYTADQIVHWWTLLHEIVHYLQKKKWNILFYYLFLWPISQGVVLLLFCWLPVFWSSGWWLLLWIGSWVVIASIHFIPQIPDPWRAHWEYQAYCVSMKTYFDRWEQLPDSYIERLVTLFADMSYYQMEPNKDKMRKKLQSARVAILQDKVPMGASPYYEQAMIIYKNAEVND